MEATKTETTAAIIAEMRKGETCNLPFAYMIGEGTPSVVDPIAHEVEEPRFCLRKVTVAELADRLEDAINRELGNVKAMREALNDACFSMFNFLKTQSGGFEEMADALDKAKVALSLPTRQCDVGTPEVQTERMWDEYCSKYECIACEHGVERHCPLYNIGIDCRLKWSQTPYKPTTEGVKK